MKRRHLLTFLPAASLAQSDAASKIHLATNVYPWMTFARRAGEKFQKHSEQLLGQIASTGIQGYEPIIDGVEDFQGLGNRLKKHKLEMRSLYVNSTLHEKAQVETSSQKILAIAREAKKLGTKIIVTNPSPIRWGGTESKSDSQLKLQAQALDELGSALKNEGLTLAYHNHDVELRHGAREFHHMLTATSPENVRFCLDAHWVFRGCGNSEVAVFDALAHYAERVVELHLRQSNNGIWTEAFQKEGDINYQRLFDQLSAKNIIPHYVLEQAVEAQSPKTLSASQAHHQSRKNFYL